MEQRIFILTGYLINNFPQSTDFKKYLIKRIEIGSYSWDCDISDELLLYRSLYSNDVKGLMFIDKTEIEIAYRYGEVKQQELYDKVIAFEKKYRGTNEAVEFLVSIYNFNITEKQNANILDLVKKYYMENEKASSLFERIPTSKLPGTKVNFGFTDLISNKKYSLMDFEGKLIVLDFWATWCSPCRESIPEIRTLHNKYKDQVIFIGISLDKESASVSDFCTSNNMPWFQFFSPNETESLANKYSVTSIPTIILLDKERRIITNEARFKLEELIKNYL